MYWSKSIVGLVRRRGGGLVAVADGDRDFLVVLDQVGGDAGVREPGGRPLAPREADLGGIGLDHVEHLVGDRFDFVFRVRH